MFPNTKEKTSGPICSFRSFRSFRRIKDTPAVAAGDVVFDTAEYDDIHNAIWELGDGSPVAITKVASLLQWRSDKCANESPNFTDDIVTNITIICRHFGQNIIRVDGEGKPSPGGEYCIVPDDYRKAA